MDQLFHPTIFNGCYYLSTLGVKLFHASKKGFPIMLTSNSKKHYLTQVNPQYHILSNTALNGTVHRFSLTRYPGWRERNPSSTPSILEGPLLAFNSREFHRILIDRLLPDKSEMLRLSTPCKKVTAAMQRQQSIHDNNFSFAHLLISGHIVHTISYLCGFWLVLQV